MSFHDRKRRLILSVLISLLFAITACSIGATQAPPTPTAPPEVIVTEVITQVVVATTAAPSPTPNYTPTTALTVTPTWDPYSAPIWYPLKDCVASRLHVGDKAMVTYGGTANGIRYGRDIHYDTIAGYAQPGQIIDIIDGPWCSQGWMVWMVKTADGLSGYTPEGDGNSYWLLPVQK
jgi:hypothetical protein